MEGVERYSSELHDQKVHLAPYQEMFAHGRVLDPKDLILPKEADVERLMPWIEGYDIANDEEIIVPAHAVFHPFHPITVDPSEPTRTALPREIRLRKQSFTHCQK